MSEKQIELTVYLADDVGLDDAMRIGEEAVLAVRAVLKERKLPPKADYSLGSEFRDEASARLGLLVGARRRS